MPGTKTSVAGVTPGGNVSHLRGTRRLGPEVDGIVVEHIRRQGIAFLAQLGNLAVSVPTMSSIEDALATLIQTELATADHITIWPPKDSGSLPLTINDVTVKVLSDALVLAVNRDAGADDNALGNILAAAIWHLLFANGVQNAFETQKRLENPFHRYHGDDHDFDLKSLSLSLRTGALISTAI